MVELGRFNKLEVIQIVDFGLYLDGGDNTKILLPNRYIIGTPHIGDKIDVFIYRDSEQRLIATTEHPYLQVNEFGYLTVAQVTKVGAFLDWGLMKHLLVPFREQKVRMEQGKRYLVYAYVDNTTQRIVASAKIERFLGNKIPQLKRGEVVEALIYQRTDIGYKVIVNNLYYGMIYHNELYQSIKIGDKIKAYVKNIREDYKIDLTLSGYVVDRIKVLVDSIVNMMQANDGKLLLSDKSSPEEIKNVLSCSKKDFKKAVGLLLKNGLIILSDTEIMLKNSQ